MKKAITFISALLFTCLFALSCKKGETGPAGADGKDGTNGTNGKDGKNGVSNISTSNINTNNNSWIFDSSDNSYYANLYSSAITQTVVDAGTVQVFLGNGSGTAWSALPFSIGIVQYNFSYALGKVQILVTLSNGNVPSNPGGVQFKLVIIPPANKSSSPNQSSQAIEQFFTVQ